MAFVLSAVIVYSLGFLVNLTITQPLSQLAAVAKKISDGDTQARTSLQGQDELSLVGSSINLMLDRISRLVAEAQGQRDFLQGRIDQLVSQVSGIGEGNLNIQAEVSTDDLGVLADSFNYMVEELSRLVLRVKRVVGEVEQATAQTAKQMAHLVENAQRQIQQTGVATQQVGQIASVSQRLEDLGRGLGQSALQTSQAAEMGRKLLQQTSQAIKHIHERVHGTAISVAKLSAGSEEIGTITELISTLAQNTQRLALDASIQAAMAGEHGKGFAAVAEEIRRFSERAKAEAQKITKIVRGVREDIFEATYAMQETERETDVGARLIKETEEALLRIFQHVEQQAREIERVHLHVEQQLQFSHAAVQSIQEVAVIAKHNDQTTLVVKQQMKTLTDFAGTLQQSVEVFQVRADVALASS
ncbi:hypothetical protein KSF_106280 [Reticulibacter mediterranei]|uniref:Methyl-accepting chemotaxis protein n=2 Tax=Reticulibacter mediterranei TaxID=2778369 RepID=A0A8J3IY28_9CHLR|nr:hypothetical protein KSF_106280 [Reticulibacter mediterranei]